MSHRPGLRLSDIGHRRPPKDLAFLCEHDRARARDQAKTGVDDHVKHRLNVRRRTGDHLENFRRRGLSFQRLLRFVEKADILDGDHGLVREGLHQRNLFVAEGPGNSADDGQNADAFGVTHQRHHEGRANALPLMDPALVFRQFHLGPIRDVQHRFALEHPGRKVAGRIDWLGREHGGFHVNIELWSGRNSTAVRGAIAAHQECARAGNHTQGRVDNGIEHRLHVGVRTTDHTQDLSRRGLAVQ